VRPTNVSLRWRPARRRTQAECENRHRAGVSPAKWPEPKADAGPPLLAKGNARTGHAATSPGRRREMIAFAGASVAWLAQSGDAGRQTVRPSSPSGHHIVSTIPRQGIHHPEGADRLTAPRVRSRSDIAPRPWPGSGRREHNLSSRPAPSECPTVGAAPVSALGAERSNRHDRSRLISAVRNGRFRAEWESASRCRSW